MRIQLGSTKRGWWLLAWEPPAQTLNIIFYASPASECPFETHQTLILHSILHAQTFLLKRLCTIVQCASWNLVTIAINRIPSRGPLGIESNL